MAAKKKNAAPEGKESPAGGYRVLARRFRPSTLDEVVGQEAILETLRQALDSGAVPHAFLFSGSRGVGKTTLARILARCLNCEQGVSAAPCGSCAACRSILGGGNGDVMEIDAASHNLVDDIRELRDRVGFASMGARYKVYILDEVHMLTRSAFNAFLKTLEEPPPSVVFILATTELHKVPDTIRSRCQVLLFQSLGEDEIVQRLTRIGRDEGLELPATVYLEIARAARGGMRDAETMLERILPIAKEKGAAFTLEDYRRLAHRTGLDEVVAVVRSLVQGEAAPAMHFVAELVASGIDEREVLGEVLEVLRALLLLRVDGPDSGLVRFGGELRAELQGLAAAVDLPRLDAMVQAGLLGRERIRRLEDRRLVLEVSMLRMAEAGRLPDLAALIEQLGAGTGTGTGTVPGAPVAAAGGGPVSAAAPAQAQAHAPAHAPAHAHAQAQAPAPMAPPGSLKDRLLQACRERKGMLAPTLELCAIHEPDAGDVVRIVVETERRLHRDRMAASGVQDDVRAMLRELLGRPVTLDVSAGGEPATPERAAPPPTNRAVPGPAARKILERFDGRTLEVDEESP